MDLNILLTKHEINSVWKLYELMQLQGEILIKLVKSLKL